jgi:hypothetical protein
LVVQGSERLDRRLAPAVEGVRPGQQIAGQPVAAGGYVAAPVETDRVVAGGQDHLADTGIHRAPQQIVGTDDVDLEDVLEGRLGADPAEVDHRLGVLARLRDRLGVKQIDGYRFLAGLNVIDINDVGQAQDPILAAQHRPEQSTHVAGGAGDQ